MQDNHTTTDNTSQSQIYISVICNRELSDKIQSLINTHIDKCSEICIDLSYGESL